MEGPNCDQRPTILTSYKKRPSPKVKPIGQTSAFLEGWGDLEYQVNFDGPPQMGMRFGVLCGFGDCGRG
ncbi:hypothetical protein TELCIR_11592 [Teladorsagia circumcincta]|uniref:Uncharacterized protein n=1 Tax=Teladorsagia circumcincta TaxID=45464 RepID=A0A2G9U8U5_TELCI|nr:hypothetical protein TELCIR_11592 [Teladorsagia circumcincta]